MAMLDPALLIHLLQGVTIVLDHCADKLLAHDFFWLGADIAPFLAQWNP